MAKKVFYNWKQEKNLRLLVRLLLNKLINTTILDKWKPQNLKRN
jgi:hypothetical protein